MKLLGSTEKMNGKNVPHLEIAEVIWAHCNIVNNDYQQDSITLYTFAPNKAFASLIEVFSPNHIFLETFNSEFQKTKVWFTDQNSRPLEVEEKIKVTLIIK